MQTLLILGAGTAGTMVANKMSHELDSHDWRIIVVDKSEVHYYQPGYLFIPFGIYQPEDVVKLKKNFLPQNVEVIFSEIDRIEADQNLVVLKKNNQVIEYDELVIATGTDIRPDEIEGMTDGGWYENVFDFYTYDGAVALSQALQNFEKGRLVINIAEMPIKCPVAPLEFSLLADSYFRQKGIRDQVEIVYSTPLDGAFTKPIANKYLSDVVTQRGIDIVGEFNIGEVDHGKQVIRSWDEREVGYDLLVTIPTNMGDEVIERSGLGDELNFVPVNKYSLQSDEYENIWAIGDASNVPTSKAGSVAHFMLDVLVDNLKNHINGEPIEETFDGHANCFIETGNNKAILVDFNYEVEPLPGRYPVPGVGPFTLLEESRANHVGKLAFKWVYWNILLKGRPVPVSHRMSMAGKKPEPTI